jgi:CBS domain containing-hemolysin-like protein
MALLLVYVALALSVSFLCSVMEAVILSVSPSYVAALDREGEWIGERLQKMKDDIDRPLAAILSLNTIAHTVGAAGAGAQAATVFGETYTGIIAAVLTLLILVFSEIIPKTLGAVYWRQLAPVVVRVLAPTIFIMKPLVLLSKGITYLLSSDNEQTSFSREEFTAMAEIGEEEGVFEEKESRILRNLFRFNSLRVRDVMTPRTVVFDLPEEKTIGEIVSEHDEFRFSRIPVYSSNRDDITGYVLKDEMLLRAAQEELNIPLSELSREMLVVRENLPLPDLLERLLDRLEHIALVVDEYGGMAGIVSMEDVVETLLGMEIVDEADSVEDMQALARQQWFKRAKELGMVPDDALDPDAGAEAILRYSITEGKPPLRAANPDKASSSDRAATPESANSRAATSDAAKSDAATNDTAEENASAGSTPAEESTREGTPSGNSQDSSSPRSGTTDA